MKAKCFGCINAVKARLGQVTNAPVESEEVAVTNAPVESEEVAVDGGEKDTGDAFVVHDEDDEHDNDEMFQHEEEDDEEEFLLEDTGNGEGFMAVKPWIGAMVAPSEYEDAFISTEKPSEELKLDWVFGYTKEDEIMPLSCRLERSCGPLGPWGWCTTRLTTHSAFFRGTQILSTLLRKALPTRASLPQVGSNTNARQKLLW